MHDFMKNKGKITTEKLATRLILNGVLVPAGVVLKEELETLGSMQDRYGKYTIVNTYHVHILQFPSFRQSRLKFYWKELRSCNMAQNFRLLPEQIIGYLFFLFFFLLKKNILDFIFGDIFLLKN